MTVNFEFLASEAVTLLGTTKVKGALTTVPVAGFSTVGSCRIDVDVNSIRGTGIRSFTLIVEDSPDGEVWSTVHSWTFNSPGTASFEATDVDDLMRVRFTTGGGLREATVGSVVVVPARDASVSDDSQAILLTSVNVSSAEIKVLRDTPKEILPAPGGRFYYLPHNAVIHYRAGTTPYGTIGSSSLSLGWEAASPADGSWALFPAEPSPDAGFDTQHFLAQVDDTYDFPVAGLASAGYDAWAKAGVEDRAFVLSKISGGNPTLGDGTLTVRIWYSLIDGAP